MKRKTDDESTTIKKQKKKKELKLMGNFAAGGAMKNVKR